MTVQTTWGPITLTLDNRRVTACSLPPLDETPAAAFSLDGFETVEELVNAFPTAGIPGGTDFQKAVWREIATIPRGETRTYGEIAAAIGRPKAVRAVGTACGANPLPLFIPCHRVTGANGNPGGFSAGLPWKKRLLELEEWNRGRME